ncbi:unnamed protein product [marine sediment metagenome]|uniref:Uncharacterized protein n=1 Tax=marine sediment metagenome TaxID=412755 RepID=X1UQR1_9ZZZZ
MDLKQALQAAKDFMTYGEPGAAAGSFEPIKATYNKEKNVWVVICHFHNIPIISPLYKRDFSQKTAKVEIHASSWEIVGYEVLEIKG